MSAEPPAPLDRRALLRRMAIGGAAVWATPMMQSVASAQALASCNGPQGAVLNWDTFTTGASFVNTPYAFATTTVTMLISGVTNTTLLPNNGRILAGPAGGINQKHLRFEMTPDDDGTNSGSRQTVTFNFSTPVTNVQFSFFDIDNVTDAWGDRIVINSPALPLYTFTKPGPSTVIGNGTNTGTTATTGRFRNSQANNNLPATSNQGNVNLTFPGPLTSFNFTYRNEAEEGGQNQLISMSDISFRC